MDTWRPFRRDHLDYYRDWVRKVAGRRDIFVRDADLKWARRIAPGCSLDWYANDFSRAWAWNRTIGIKCGLLERDGYLACEIRAMLLHEAGHIMAGRRYHGRAGNEFLAAIWSMRKACRLGYEVEGRILKATYRYWGSSETFRSCGGRNYRIAYRMLRKAGVL